MALLRQAEEVDVHHASRKPGRLVPVLGVVTREPVVDRANLEARPTALFHALANQLVEGRARRVEAPWVVAAHEAKRPGEVLDRAPELVALADRLATTHQAVDQLHRAER